MVAVRLARCVIVGLLGPRSIPPSDLRVWEASRVHAEGGMLRVLTAWYVGQGVTRDCVRVLCRVERRIGQRVTAIINANPSLRTRLASDRLSDRLKGNSPVRVPRG